VQERDDALLQIQQQVEKHRDVASLEEQHAAVIASMRSQLNAARERAATSEQQEHIQEIHMQRLQISSDPNLTADPSISDELQQLRVQIAGLQEQVTRLQQETQQAVTAREEAEMQMQKASDMVAAVQRSRDESLLKEKEAVFQVRSAITAVFQSLISLICRTVAKYVGSTRQSAPSC
jgi:chromosome segregation ATPase